MRTKIRLSRFGAKKKPFYRIIVAGVTSPRDGRFLDLLGTYDPQKGIKQAVVDKEKVKVWLGRGAEPTQIVRQILKNV